MPSVVRIAEQRVGRVDRLNSPHSSIEAWWPNDSPEFALTSDERLVERFETVEQLIGSNMPLPEHLQGGENDAAGPVSTQQLIKELEDVALTPWDGIDDAFSPVRELVTGPNALISPHVYDRYRKVTENVMSRVSLVSAKTPWAFFCLRAGSFGAPRWILFSTETASPDTELSKVCSGLRALLTPDVQNLQFDERAVTLLNSFLSRLPPAELSLLSKRKQRAVAQLLSLAKHLHERHRRMDDTENVKFLSRLVDILSNRNAELHPDWDEIAARWLEAIRPVWFDKLKEKRSRPLLLKDIRKDLESDPQWLMVQMRKYFASIPQPRRIDERVRACIVGVS